MYKVKEIFSTLQGEGCWTGRAAVFIRFAGCNLWTGREEDRGSATCKFCDTDFLGGERLSASEICERAVLAWGGNAESHRFCVLTGGEPMLQVDYSLAETLRRFGFYIAIETNGTREVNGSADWITVSPKAGAELVQRAGDELKLVYPQDGIDPSQFEPMLFDHFFLQPMDGPSLAENTAAAVDYCLANPRWRMSVQAHKVLGIR